jgi:hypothetical protein
VKLVEIGTIADLLGSEHLRQRLLESVRDHDVCVIRRFVDPSYVASIVSYLSQVGRSSLPNRHATQSGCPNHHRAYTWDERSYVKGCYHQFSFFPWNEDIFTFFNVFRPIYQLRNLLSGKAADEFLSTKPQDGCIARLSFQFYPSALGAMNKHADPIDIHQQVVPVMVMSERGRDFRDGGLFFEAPGGERLYVEGPAQPGDIVLSHAQHPHGVEKIDPDAKPDWLSFEGRWSTVFAVNKLADSAHIADPIDFDRPGRKVG